MIDLSHISVVERMRYPKIVSNKRTEGEDRKVTSRSEITLTTYPEIGGGVGHLWSS